MSTAKKPLPLSANQEYLLNHMKRGGVVRGMCGTVFSYAYRPDTGSVVTRTVRALMKRGLVDVPQDIGNITLTEKGKQ